MQPACSHFSPARCSSLLSLLPLGVWSGSSKPFEIVYVSLWYLGPLNKVPGLDFIGAQTNGRPEFFIPLSLALIAFAFFGRARQVQN